MKIRVDIDVSPDELRQFLGLPDVRPLQAEMLERVREQLRSGAAGIDPVALMRPFLAPNPQTMENMQRAFWQAFTRPARDDANED